MDTSIIYDSLKIAISITTPDSVVIIDTSTKTFSEGLPWWQIVLEIGKVVVPVIAVYIAYRAFKHGLEKDKKAEEERLKLLEKHILFSLKNLKKATVLQINYINEFKNQFNSHRLEINPVSIATYFDDQNFASLDITDIYKIFIEISSKEFNIKTKAYNDLNFSVKVTKKISENLEPAMNQFINRQNELIKVFNTYSPKFTELLNAHISLRNNNQLTIPHKIFINTTLALCTYVISCASDNRNFLCAINQKHCLKCNMQYLRIFSNFISDKSKP